MVAIPISCITFIFIKPYDLQIAEKLSVVDRTQTVDTSMMILSEDVLSKISNSSVDILGYSISYVHFNRLNYNPRPIIQSYQCYSKELIDLNFNKYVGANAPDFILFNFGSIDDRHPFWDEPKIYLALFSNYHVEDTVVLSKDTLLLFQRNIESLGYFAERTILDTTIEVGSTIDLPRSEKILFLKVFPQYTFLGLLRRILYQPSLAYIDLNYEDDDFSTHRLILPVMRSGVPINKKVLDYPGAEVFFNKNGRDNINTNSFRIRCDKRYFKDEFRIEISEYNLQ